MASSQLKGSCASAGFAEGRLHVLTASPGHKRTQGTVAEEHEALHAAVAKALEQTQSLLESCSGDAADMLAFQSAMLEDDELIAPALDAIVKGGSADSAFSTAMDVEIAGYEAAEDDYFRARSADLKDIKARVLAALFGVEDSAALSGIVMADDLTPSQFLRGSWHDGAIILRKGSVTSHVAMLARGRGVPMVVGLDHDIADGALLLVDATQGTVIVDPNAAEQAQFLARKQASAIAEGEAEQYRLQSVSMPDGEAVSIMINISGPDDLKGLDPHLCDGIGLVRTELLFEGRAAPCEDEQYAIYRDIVQWAAGRPVIFRTLDAGGDKPIKGLTVDGESNPFLGVRGLRLSLRHPEHFRTQLRAMVRAAQHGTAKIMLPMVSLPEELEAARGHLAEVSLALNLPQPPLGIMIEVPAAALALDLFRPDFASIGSNDLTQYVMAAGRDIAGLTHLANAGHEAVLRLISLCAEQAAALRIPLSLCGDAGGDPALVPKLLDCGLRSLSMAPRNVGGVKQTIALLQADDGHV